jgi:adenosylcobinamide-GDP ribazoletransferase
MGLLAALQFLTILPPVVRRPFAAAELGRAVGWFALVGLLLGLLLAAADWAMAGLFPRIVSAVLILMAWVVITGALHLDGWLDSCDGLFGGQTPEARLRIMRDERAGAFAVIGGVLLLLLKFACLAALNERTMALIFAPMLGRWAMTAAMATFPYGRAEGLGRDMKDQTGLPQLALGTSTLLLVVLAALSLLSILALLAAVLVIIVAALIVLRRLPGFTGDTYGAVCEWVEASTLLVFVAGEMP